MTIMCACEIFEGKQINFNGQIFTKVSPNLERQYNLNFFHNELNDEILVLTQYEKVNSLLGYDQNLNLKG